MDGDHSGLILAPKASKDFIVKRQKRRVKIRPLPESKMKLFCLEMTQHKWTDVLEAIDVDQRTEHFHKFLQKLLNKYFPEKSVSISSLDKQWMTPQLKQILRQAQRERLTKGKCKKFKELWAKFRKLKRKQIKNFHKVFVEDLKLTDPSKWYKKMQQLGGLDQMNRGKLFIKELEGLTNSEYAEAVAQSFAAVSQEYSKLDRTKLPAFLPAGPPEQVIIFQVFEKIKSVGKTKSTLPIDLPDKLRIECALDLAEPMCNIINSWNASSGESIS